MLCSVRQNHLHADAGMPPRATPNLAYIIMNIYKASKDSLFSNHMQYWHMYDPLVLPLLSHLRPSPSIIANRPIKVGAGSSAGGLGSFAKPR